MVLALLAISLAGAFVLAATRHDALRDPLRGPAAPYDHPGLAEVSVATEDVIAGQARTVVEGLRRQGLWCVQVRSNERAVQIACRMPDSGDGVDLVTDTAGDVLYADVDVGPSSSGEESADRLIRWLDDSILRLWPQDRAVVERLLQDAQPSTFFPSGGEAAPDAEDQFSTHDERTADASWSLWAFHTGDPLALRIRTPRLRDRSWPLGGGHYATPLSVATAALRAAGFTCATACSRAADDQQVRFDVHRDQIVAAQFTLHSSAGGDRGADPSGRWIREGLPFLTHEVRSVIGQRIERCRVNGRSWRGVLAGTPLAIRAVPGGLTPDGRAATDLEVDIGLPLLHVE